MTILSTASFVRGGAPSILRRARANAAFISPHRVHLAAPLPRQQVRPASSTPTTGAAGLRAADASREGWSRQALRWGWGWNPQIKTWTNWHNSLRVTPEYFDLPETRDDILAILKDAREKGQKLKVVGTGCSPNTMAVCQQRMLSTDNYNKIISVDEQKGTVRVQAGVTLAQLNEFLAEHNLGLSVLSSISEQSMGGALACAIHGTGGKFPCMSDYIEALELITPRGEVIECSATQNADIFKAALCHVGALGVVSEMTIKCEPAFKLRSSQRPVPLEDVLSNIDERVGTAEHYRFWWFPHTDMCIEWKANRVPIYTPNKSEGDWVANQFLIFNYVLETVLWLTRFFPPSAQFVNQVCRAVAFNQVSDVVDRSDKVFNFDCLFRQYVDEWSIPRGNCAEAVRRLKKFIESRPEWGVHFPVEVRFSRADDIWLSPCSGQDTCWIGVIMYRPWNAEPPPFWREYFQGFEEIMDSLGGRPHWAKEHKLTYKDLYHKYPKFREWCQLRDKVDPDGMMVNPYVEKIIDQERPSWREVLRDTRRITGKLFDAPDQWPAIPGRAAPSRPRNETAAGAPAAAAVAR